MSLCAQLFATHSNVLHVTNTGFECGHEPAHTSKSGRCVTIDSTKDVWYCRSCTMGGGLVQAFMSLEGLSLVDAEARALAMGATAKPPRRPTLPASSAVAAALVPALRDVLRYDVVLQQWRVYGSETPGVWSVVEPTAAHERVYQALAARGLSDFSWGYFCDVEHFLRMHVRTTFTTQGRALIPFASGVYDPQTHTFTPHDPSQYWTWALPYSAVAGTDCPQTQQVLQQMVGHDAQLVQLLRAWIRATLLGRTDYHKCLELLGPGGTGKSTFIHLLQALLGLRNTGTTSLKRLETNRFELIDLVTKKLVVITDSERYTGSVATLKAWIGQDTLPLERKYAKFQQQGAAEGLLVIAANEAIASADYTSGLARRRLTVVFRHNPPLERRLLEPQGQQFTGELAAELPYVLNWALALPDAEMDRLLRAPRDAVTAVHQEWTETLLSTNPLADWADQALIHQPGQKTYVGVAQRIKDPQDPNVYYEQHSHLYPHYCAYAESIKAYPVGKHRFSSLLEDLLRYQLRLAGTLRKRDKDGWHLTDVVLRSETDLTTPPLFTRRPPPAAPAGSDVGYAGSSEDVHHIFPSNGAGDVGYVGYAYLSETSLNGEGTRAEEKKEEEEGTPLDIEKEKEPTSPTSPTFASNGAVLVDVGRCATPTQPTSTSTAATLTVGPTHDLPEQEFVTTARRLEAVVSELLGSPRVGLDTETTGLDWQTARLRLVQLATPSKIVLVDAFQCPLQPLIPLVQRGGEVVGHNLKFDLHLLAAAGLPWPAHLTDTMLLAQLLGAAAQQGAKVSYSLADVVQRSLGIPLDKTLQTSDWTGALTPEQVQYAARDAAVLLPLADALTRDVHAADLTQVVALEHDCLPALVWMEQAGVPVDTSRWLDLAHRHTHDTVKLEAELHALLARARNGHGALFPAPVNWNSPTQVLQVLTEHGHQVPNTASETLTPLAAQDPLVAHLLAYREARIRARVFGEPWLTKHRHSVSGRVHANYFQLGSAAGRMSCTRPNMQNIPRSSAYRRCFRPADGRCVIKADYSQIELRIAAVMAHDTTMLTAFQAGDDIHRLTAARLLGVAVADVTPEHRQLAKAVNFGLLYGMGAPRLQAYAQQQYRVALTLDAATAHRKAFFAFYQGLRRWHGATGAALTQAGRLETRTLTNRRRLDVGKFTEALNTPVQGTGADGLKAALARLWTHRHEAPDARVIACIHDEVVAECPAEQAAKTAAWMHRHMAEAMQAIVGPAVPIAVETTIGQDWAGTPLAGVPTPT